MSDCLRGLVETIIRSLPVEDPHAQQQQQQRSIVNLRLVDHTEPFSPSNHMGPQSIIKVQVRKDVIPPAMMGGRLILPLLVNPMEGVLGNLPIFSSAFLQAETKRKITSIVVG